MRNVNVVWDDILHEKCPGCGKINELGKCVVYATPSSQWSRLMGCASRTHMKVQSIEDKKLNPMKASKRGVKQ
jgi:hypothetical protein